MPQAGHASARGAAGPRRSTRTAVSLLGVPVANLSRHDALELLTRLLQEHGRPTTPIYIVNAHTLNLAWRSRPYCEVLSSARCVFADGTGARWAARLRGVQLKANLVGTDLIPELFSVTAGRGYRYYLLGAAPGTIARTAQASMRLHPGWELAGFHHGYISGQDESDAVIERINAAHIHLLLVGMGNPLQEVWIHQHRERLRVPVSIGVGGLFDHWAGDLHRAPLWVRRHGLEWLQILLQQPHKWRRYLLGNPSFLVRALRSAVAERACD
jgi:N-acetylglucosaminyldiphosphoundecaprenol N-acetyl-beta-D-mannosaminyltransferase